MSAGAILSNLSSYKFCYQIYRVVGKLKYAISYYLFDEYAAIVDVTAIQSVNKATIRDETMHTAYMFAELSKFTHVWNKHDLDTFSIAITYITIKLMECSNISHICQIIREI